MPTLTPVDGNPFAQDKTPKLTAVEGNPFEKKAAPAGAKLTPVAGNPFEATAPENNTEATNKRFAEDVKGGVAEDIEGKQEGGLKGFGKRVMGHAKVAGAYIDAPYYGNIGRKIEKKTGFSTGAQEATGAVGGALMFAPEAAFGPLSAPFKLIRSMISKPEDVNEAAATARQTEDALAGLSGHNTADTLTLNKERDVLMNKTTKQARENVYHAIEDPRLVSTLKPEEKTLLSDLSKAKTEEAQLHKEVTGLKAKYGEALGHATGEEEGTTSQLGYMHRIVAGKGHPFDANLGETPDPLTGGGRTLPKTTSSMKGRTMHAIENAQGERRIVSITPAEHGKVSVHISGGGKPEQKFLSSAKDEIKPGGSFVDPGEGGYWNVKPATTKEIEGATSLRYHKDAVANTYDNLMKLRRTKRNIEFLEHSKTLLKEKGLAFDDPTKAPAGFRQTQIPQLRGMYFDPRLAEVYDDFYKPGMGMDGWIAKVNALGIKGMFINPIPHVENVLTDYLISRGKDNFTPWGAARAVKHTAQAIKDVKNISPEYIAALKEGAPLMAPSSWQKQAVDTFNAKLRKEMLATPGQWDGLAKNLGMTVKEMTQKVFNVSQAKLWEANDVLLMSRVRELMADKGLSLKEAIHEAQKHLVSYRVPSRVMGSRGLARFMQGNPVAMFTRYHYGIMKSLGETLSKATSGDPAKTKEAVGEIFTTYFMNNILMPLLSEDLSEKTGKNIEVRSPGAAGLVKNSTDFIEGNITLSQFLKRQLIASPVAQVGLGLLEPKEEHPMLEPHDIQKALRADPTAAKHLAEQMSDYFLRNVQPMGGSYQYLTGKEDLTSWILRQIGASTKSESSKMYGQRDLKDEEKSALRRDMALDQRYQGLLRGLQQ